MMRVRAKKGGVWRGKFIRLGTEHRASDWTDRLNLSHSRTGELGSLRREGFATEIGIKVEAKE